MAAALDAVFGAEVAGAPEGLEIAGVVVVGPMDRRKA
jgi:hypothetical protein